jgi:hypothetical protein
MIDCSRFRATTSWRVLLVPPSCLLGPHWFEKSYEDSEEKVGQFETMAKGHLHSLPEDALGERYTPERAADFVKFAEARYPR